MLLDDLSLDVGQHLRVNRSSESRDWIPSLGSVESLAVGITSTFGTDVVTMSDISESSRVRRGHLVQERGDKTEGLSGLGVDVVVEERDDTGEDGGRSRSSSNRFDGSSGKDEDLRTESGNIRESSSVRVVVSAWGKLNSRFEVVGNGGTLVNGLRGDVGETTSRGEVGLSEAYALFGTGRSAVLSRAARRRVREVSSARSGGDLGSTDGGDVRRGSREDRVEVSLRAGRIGTSVSTRVSRGADEGDSTKTNLLEFSVDTLNVLGVVETHLLAFSTTNTVLALGFLVPTVGDGVDERNVLGGEHVAGETVQPNVVLLDPEPTLSSKSDSEDVLDIEGGLNLRIGWVVVTNDVVRGKRRDWDGEGGREVGEISRGVVLIFKLDDTSRGVTSNLDKSVKVKNLFTLAPAVL